jgi:hypothetical protein
VRQTLQDVVAAELPPAFVSAIYPLLGRLYTEAAAYVRENRFMEEPEHRNLLPYARRNMAEKGLRDLASNHGLRGTVEWTETRSAQFTMIRTPRIRLTISKTAHEWAVPETCYFRKTNSVVNDMLMQGNLWPVSAPEQNDSELLYAILTHGPAPKSEALGFVNIGFPRPDMKAWAEPTVSILDIEQRQQQIVKPADPMADEQERQRTAPLKEAAKKIADEAKDREDDEGECTA